MAQTALHGLRLLLGQLLLCEPHPALLAEQITDRRAAEQAAGEHRVHLALHARARPHQSRTASDPPAQRPRAPWSLRLVGVGVLALLAWLLFGSALSAARAVVALAGYVVVALLAYVVGKWVGRHQASR